MLPLRSCCCLLLSAVLAAADDWPVFRGPARDGQSPATGLASTWPAEGLPLRWRAEGLGQGFASAVVAGDLVVTAGEGETGTTVIALGRDGRPRWRAAQSRERWRVPKDKKDWAQPHGGARATPTLADGRVFHLDAIGRLAAFRAEDGVEVWHRDLVREFGGRPNEWGYSESVLVEGGVLYCLPGGPEAQALALDAATGAERWRGVGIPDPQYRRPDTASNASGVLLTINGVRQFVTMTTVNLAGFAVADGRLLWSARHANRFRENCEIPLWTGDLLIVSSGYRHGSEGWRLAVDAGGVWTATRAWHRPEADNLHGGPVLCDGVLVGAGYEHRGAYGLDPTTGALLWRDKTVGRSAILRAGGLLYVLGEDGRLSLVRADRTGWTVVSSFTLPGAGPCHAHPVFVGRDLLVRRGDVLSCYDAGTGQGPSTAPLTAPRPTAPR